MAKKSSSSIFGEEFNFQLHQKVIIGTFVLGTLAFLVGHAWNEFFSSIVRAQVFWSTGEDESGETIKPDNSAILWYGVYATSATLFAIIVVFVMIKFNFLTE